MVDWAGALGGGPKGTASLTQETPGCREPGPPPGRGGLRLPGGGWLLGTPPGWERMQGPAGASVAKTSACTSHLSPSPLPLGPRAHITGGQVRGEMVCARTRHL